jgi:glycosyltransferase involved in cell wall biosynthesis
MPAEPRRILMTADAVGGVWTYALDLARGLASSGIHFTIASMGPEPSATQRQAAASIPNVDLATSRYRLEWMDDPWDDVARAGEWLLSLEHQVRPDIVHVNGYAHASLPFRAPVVVVAHSCVLSWDAAIPGRIAARALEAYARHAGAGLLAADLVVAPSRAMLDALVRVHGTPGRSLVIPNGRRAELFAPAASGKEPVIVTAGRLWDAAKNVAAVAAVAERLPWRVAVAGSGNTDRRCVEHLGSLGEREMAAWLARASIFALPARYEPFGLLPVEAALSGCALVLGDIASLREVWGDAADFVPPEDHAQLAQALLALIESPNRLAARAAAARGRAARYSLEAMAHGYREAYRIAAQVHGAREEAACAS